MKRFLHPKGFHIYQIFININYYRSTDNAFHKLSSGTGATIRTFSFETGWINSALRACKLMPPSLLERSKPYFRSPLIGHPIFAN